MGTGIGGHAWSPVPIRWDRFFIGGARQLDRERADSLITSHSALLGYGRGAGVGRTLGCGLDLGVGVGRGVAVGVVLGVAVAVGVGVELAVGVGVGVPFPVGAWIATIIGVPVLKNPTVALASCGG